MELSIDRLKVLAEEDITRLDAKIQEYRISNNPTILDKDIMKLRTKLNDMKAIRADLEAEYKIKQEELNTINRALSASNIRYSEKETTLANLKVNIAEAEELLSKYPDKFTEITQQIDTQSTELAGREVNVARQKEELSKMELEVVKRKAEFHTKQIKYDAVMINLKKQMLDLQAAATANVSDKLLDFMKFSDGMELILSQPLTIQLDTPKTTAELIFDKIQIDLMKIMGKRADNYCIVREWYKDMIDSRWHSPRDTQPTNEKNPTNKYILNKQTSHVLRIYKQGVNITDVSSYKSKII